MNRRHCLRLLGGLGAGALTGGLLPRRGEGSPSSPGSARKRRKLIVVVFGGGTRSSESIGDPEHRFVPRLWGDLVPRGTLFNNARVEHKVVHPNATGSILTGHREWDDIDWSRPVAHPTIFETHRKETGASDTKAWVFVYASILAKAGESSAVGYGTDYAANVVEPPTIPRSTSVRMDGILRRAAARGSIDSEVQAARECARIARTTSRIATGCLRSREAREFMRKEYSRWKAAGGTPSHDAFLTQCALSCMETFAPDVLTLAFGEIDCAHYGSWSRYVEAIRRTDELTWRVWRRSEELPAYRGRTLMLILPDHGRELESSGGSGFVHHSDFYTGQGADEGCRRVWMLAVGPGVRKGLIVDRPVPTTAAAATGLEFLGHRPSEGAAGSLLGEIR